MSRQAGIIGTNWGRVHIGALRAAGVDVIALCGQDPARVAAVAAEEDIPRAHTDPEELADLDIVVIATPAHTHAGLIRRFPQQAVICEKPLLGRDGRLADVPDTQGPVWINYAFGFLDTARAARDAASRLGPLRHARLRSSVELPGHFGPVGWFLETASHPWSWMLWGMADGLPASAGGRVRIGVGRRGLRIEQGSGDGPLLSAEFEVGGLPGIHHHLALDYDGGVLSFSGHFRPGEPWAFSPVCIDDEAVTDGECVPEDCWIRANHRAVATMVAVLAGDLPRDAGLAQGLFDVPKAIRVEQPLWSRDGASGSSVDPQDPIR